MLMTWFSFAVEGVLPLRRIHVGRIAGGILLRLPGRVSQSYMVRFMKGNCLIVFGWEAWDEGDSGLCSWKPACPPKTSRDRTSRGAVKTK
eukprot:5284771-Amphidinium_carterae.1